jgi:hypothetical protein
MRIAPLQGDFLVKLALLGAAGIALLYLSGKAARTVSGGIAAAYDATLAPVKYVASTVGDVFSGYTGQGDPTNYGPAASAAYAVSPANNDNVIYQGANAAFGTPSIGGAIYDWLHPAPAPAPAYASGGGGNFAGNGATGSW